MIAQAGLIITTVNPNLLRHSSGFILLSDLSKPYKDQVYNQTKYAKTVLGLYKFRFQ